MKKSDRHFVITILRATFLGAVLWFLPMAASLADCIAWAEGLTYTRGTVVTFNNRTYTALVTHTAYAGAKWDPASTPTLWVAGGSCSPPSSTTTSNPPPPNPTLPCAVAIWDATKVYNRGDRVVFNNVIYRARGTTKGNNPSTSNLWRAVGGCSPKPPTVPPTPTTPPPVSSGNHALIGYWHNFPNPSGPAFPISQVSNAWDVIIIAFGDDGGNGTVNFTLDPGAGNETQFITDIAAKRAQGKKVVLSLGGERGSISLNTAGSIDNFVTSLERLIRKYGFDGIDLDLESPAGVTVGSPVVNNVVTAVKRLKARIGSSFYLSMAPEHPLVHGGLVNNTGFWGAYLPIINGLRDDLNVIHVQYYNNGDLTTPYSQTAFPTNTVDMLVAGSKMLIEGFPLFANAGQFNGLRPDQIAFGVPSGNSSAGSGFFSVNVINQALDCLTSLRNCGSVRPLKAYPTFRGVMTWSINWDKHDGFNFSTPVKQHLIGLP